MTFLKLGSIAAILVSVLLNAACSSIEKSKSSSNSPLLSDIALKPFWVQQTLNKAPVGFRKINRMSPIVLKEQIVVGNAMEGLTAFDIKSLQKIWSLPIPEGVEASGVAINDRLFVGSNNGRLYSIQITAKKAQIIWSFDTKSEVVAEPLLVDGVVYFLSGGQSVFALDAVSGKQIWTYNRQDTTSLMTVRGGSKPSFSNGILYVGFSDGSVVAINAKTGTQQWEISLNRNVRFKDVDASPVIDGDLIFISSYDDRVYCLSKDKGEIVWRSPYGGSSTPLIVGPSLFVTSSKGDLVALAKRDGSLLWKKSTKEGVFVDPVAYRGMIVAAESQGKINLFDSLTGEMKANFEPGRGVFSRPTVSASLNALFFISGEGNVYGLKVSNKMNPQLNYLH